MNAGKKYFKSIKRETLLQGAERKKYLQDMESCISLYMQFNPQATEEECRRAMGTPEEIGKNQLLSLPYANVRRRMHEGTLALRVTIAAAIVITLGISFLVVSRVLINAEIHSNLNGYFITDTPITHGEE